MTPLPTLDEAIIDYTKDLMGGLNQVYFAKEQQTEVVLRFKAAIQRLFVAERHAGRIEQQQLVNNVMKGFVGPHVQKVLDDELAELQQLVEAMEQKS